MNIWSKAERFCSDKLPRIPTEGQIKKTIQTNKQNQGKASETSLVGWILLVRKDDRSVHVLHEGGSRKKISDAFNLKDTKSRNEGGEYLYWTEVKVILPFFPYQYTYSIYFV